MKGCEVPKIVPYKCFTEKLLEAAERNVPKK